MRQKYFLLLVVAALVVLTGCSLLPAKAPEKSEVDLSSAEKFVLTEDEQNAVFYLGYGLTGSAGGSAPVLDLEENRTKQWGGALIFFDGAKVQEVLARGNMPSCFVGKPLIKVFARIKLEKRTEINPSIPPDEAGNQPSESFYEAKVLELKDVSIKAEKCKD